MNFFDRIKNVKIKEPTPQDVDAEKLQIADPIQSGTPQDSSPVAQAETVPSSSPEQISAPTISDNTAPVAATDSPTTNCEDNTSLPQDAPVVEELPPQTDPDMEKIQALADSLASMRSDITKLLSVSEQQVKILASSHDKDEIIQNMHRELTDYRNNFKQEIMMPMVKSMIRLYDRLAKLSSVYEGKFAAEENLPQVCHDFVSEVSGSAEVILSSLAEFDIEKIAPEKGEQFDPKRCRCIKTEPATEQNPANTISCVLKVGFENMATGRIVDYPEVIVFK